MAIELWAAVDGDGSCTIFYSEPEWSCDLKCFRDKDYSPDYIQGQLASAACRPLLNGQKGRVRSIDLSTGVIEVDLPVTAMNKLVSKLRGFLSDEVSVEELEEALREAESQ